jgi:RimJ/RimL family protein N-acetyltransferase
MIPYKIETSRLIIRCYEPSDAIQMQKVIAESKEHLMTYMAWAKHEPETVDQKLVRIRDMRGKFDLDQDYTLGIFEKNTGNYIGSSGFHKRSDPNCLEIGYWISASNEGKGYITESTKALTKVGFDHLEIDRIEIKHHPSNIKSEAIPQKLGYECEGITKRRIQNSEGILIDQMNWVMFRESFLNSELKNEDIKVFDAMGREIVNAECRM